MLLAAYAYSLRQSAGVRFAQGEAQNALAAAQAARKLHAVPQGGTLEMLCAAAVGVAKLPSAPTSPVVHRGFKPRAVRSSRRLVTNSRARGKPPTLAPGVPRIRDTGLGAIEDSPLVGGCSAFGHGLYVGP
jgi:hypothetical protein